MWWIKEISDLTACSPLVPADLVVAHVATTQCVLNCRVRQGFSPPQFSDPPYQCSGLFFAMALDSWTLNSGVMVSTEIRQSVNPSAQCLTAWSLQRSVNWLNMTIGATESSPIIFLHWAWSGHWRFRVYSEIANPNVTIPRGNGVVSPNEFRQESTR